MYRRRLTTHDTECISEPDAEDTAHRLDDDPASQAQTQRGGGDQEVWGGNKNMNMNINIHIKNNNFGGKLFRSSKGREGICVIFRSGNGCQKCPPPLPGPIFCLGNLLQWLQARVQPAPPRPAAGTVV